MKTNPKDFALEAIKKGTSVIPVGKDKIPLIQWKEYQERLATAEEIENWYKQWPEANVGIVTGKISNLSIVDVEKGGDVTRFPKTLTIRTGGGGWHLYYHYFPITNKARIFPLTDVRSEGGYVVAPTSAHASGKKYEVLESLPIAKFPAILFGEKTSEWKNKIISPIQPGSRNTDFTSIVGGLLNKFTQDDWEKIVWPLVVNQNKTQALPLNERELRTIFDSISKKEEKNRHAGGDIKDIHTEIADDEVRVGIRLEKSIICFKIKNIISSLMEGRVITWIEKSSGLSHEIPFYLKVKSDSNKEQWVRILSKAFDKKEEKEVYPWTIIITKVVDVVEKVIREHKQDFLTSETVARDATWLIEPFIQEGQINTFFGLGSSGKTLMSVYFSTLLGKQGISTLFIDYENDSHTWKSTLMKMDKTASDNLIYYDSEQIPLAEQVDKIKEVIRRRKIEVVIVDSASMATGESTSDEDSVIRLMSGLKLLKTTVLLIAHQRKNDGERTPIGSIQFENQARNVWNFKKETDDFDYKILHLACSHTKANNTYLRKDPICYRIEYGEEIKVETEDPQVAFESKISLVNRIKILLKDNPNLTYSEIAEELNEKEPVTKIALSRGKKRGFFVNEGGKWSVGF